MTCSVWFLWWLSLLPSTSSLSLEVIGSIPIQTSPNCPFPRRLISCSDSRGISHTSLVLTDRSARRGIPLWQGTTKRQQSPAARSTDATQRGTNKSTEIAQRDCKQGTKRQIQFEKCLVNMTVFTAVAATVLVTSKMTLFFARRNLSSINWAMKRMWLLAGQLDC